jgi:hypothetical protein
MAIRTRKRKPRRRRFQRRDQPSAAPAPRATPTGVLGPPAGTAGEGAAPSATATGEGAAPSATGEGAAPSATGEGSAPDAPAPGFEPSAPRESAAPSATAAAASGIASPPAPPPPAAASAATPGAAPASPLRTALRTWPRKVAAAVAAALVASGTSYFIGADFWRGVEETVGTADAPVRATTITDIDRFDSDVVHIPEFVVPRPIGRIPAPPSGDRSEGRYRWAHELGGVDASSSLMRVTLTGRDSGPVILQGLRVGIDERRPPLRGTLLSYFGLGAPQSVRYVEVDLSTDPPSWRFIGNEGEPEEHFPLRVSASEAEVFDVQAVRARGDVSWHLELEYTTADGEQGVARIDDGGEPFRTTEVRTRAQNAYGWLDGRWQPLAR